MTRIFFASSLFPPNIQLPQLVQTATLLETRYRQEFYCNVHRDEAWQHLQIQRVLLGPELIVAYC